MTGTTSQRRWDSRNRTTNRSPAAQPLLAHCDSEPTARDRGRRAARVAGGAYDATVRRLFRKQLGDRRG
jgi:hypothetical protein